MLRGCPGSLYKGSVVLVVGSAAPIVEVLLYNGLVDICFFKHLNMGKKFLSLFGFILAFVPVAASAHVGIGATSGFLPGFFHPLAGARGAHVFVLRLGARADYCLYQY